MENLTLLISILSVLVMIVGLILVLAGKKQFSGGVVGKNWNFLTGLVILFTIGYLTAPFMSLIPPEYFQFIIANILLFGAIFVIITIRLIKTIINDLMN
ncbi:MAG: hypothetical protein L6Q77_00645 [Bacteroidetes bacterium]|nr:hypothetical protein [Bacteroidota bacterium]